MRRCCSLSPDRHEIRQKRKWLVGGGWCQPVSPAAAPDRRQRPHLPRRNAEEDFSRYRGDSQNSKNMPSNFTAAAVIGAISKIDGLLGNKANLIQILVEMFRAG